MSLIASISGIRGTIGGKVGEGLSPIDTQRYALGYGLMVKSKFPKAKVVIGRDARISGEMVYNIVSSSLISLGIDVINLGLSTTPTVEKAVKKLGCQGGIILTASHNPKEWNALKLLNEVGEFISAVEGQQVIDLSKKTELIDFNTVDDLGKITQDDTMLAWHIDEISAMKWIDQSAISTKKIKVVVDGINSSGSIAVPMLLEKLGVTDYIVLNNDTTGNFAHNPEPLAPHLKEISEVVVAQKADLGIVVDPDVDRLCFVNEDGTMFGEEYTLVAVADYILSIEKGNTVSNLSSTRALSAVTKKHGGEYHASAVGEVNVVYKMKEVNAIIGGEGNGGVIFPDSHYGRDALMGIALFLSYYSQKGVKMTALKASLPQFEMAKNKIELTPEINVDELLAKMHLKYKAIELCNTVDGLKIDFDNAWVHLRKSNTEPIIRIYSEANTKDKAEQIAARFVNELLNIQIGPINKNFKSCKNDGLFPSILCPMN
jgi:phosphomannomutase